MANPMCCGAESLLKTFNTFEYYFCGECKKEVTATDSTVSTSSPVKYVEIKYGSVTAQADKSDWQSELEDLFRGSNIIITGTHETPTTKIVSAYNKLKQTSCQVRFASYLPTDDICCALKWRLGRE